MGQNDLQQSEYFASNIRFADAYNGILFNGESIIKPEELEEGDSVFVQLFETSKGKRISTGCLRQQDTINCGKTNRGYLRETDLSYHE